MNLAAGCIVEHTAKGNNPEIAAVLSVAGNNVRLYMLNGKETTVVGKRIVHSTDRPVISVSDREQCRQSLAHTDNIRKNITEKIDLSELYELLNEDNRQYSLEEISSFLFEDKDFDSYAALVRKLYADNIFFKKKNDLFQPSTSEELKIAQEQFARKQVQEAEEATLINSLRSLEKTDHFPDVLKQYLVDLKDLAADTENRKISKRLGAALDKVGLNNPKKMFQTLVRTKIFDEDENLAVIKYRLPVDFTPDVLALIDGFKSFEPTADNRIDLTELKCWAIDTPGSRDRDDAFSFERYDNGSYKLLVHIADSAQLIEPGSLLDKEAARRGSSVYMPDQRIHMLPAEISEELLSLNEGHKRIALTFALEFSSDCQLTKFDIFESLIFVEKAITYDEADTIIDSNTWLKSALDFAELLKNRRKENGALFFPRQPELSVKVIDGQICVDQRSREEMTQGMIAEFMIWANHVAAEYCRINDVPCLYRTQEGDSEKIEFGDIFNPVQFFAAIKTFRKTVVGFNPGRHYSLGLESYTQATSPLRRYADLITHRQIKASIKGKTLPYTRDTLAQTMLLADSATARADDIMRNRERYFLHKYLKEQRKDGEVILDGIVVETNMAEVIFYVDFMCGFRHCRKPNFDVAIGQKVAVKVNQIDLFDGIIRFDLRELD